MIAFQPELRPSLPTIDGNVAPEGDWARKGVMDCSISWSCARSSSGLDAFFKPLGPFGARPFNNRLGILFNPVLELLIGG